jgi:hypothetical protein
MSSLNKNTFYVLRLQQALRIVHVQHALRIVHKQHTLESEQTKQVCDCTARATHCACADGAMQSKPLFTYAKLSDLYHDVRR